MIGIKKYFIPFETRTTKKTSTNKLAKNKNANNDDNGK